MTDEINIEKAGFAVKHLAESLSTSDCEISTDEILENIEGRAISMEDAGNIREYITRRIE